MSDPNRASRRALFIAAGASAVGSVALFVFQPVPPVGLVTAIELAVVSVIWLYQGAFPLHAGRMRKKLERLTKTKDDPNEPARRVP